MGTKRPSVTSAGLLYEPEDNSLQEVESYFTNSDAGCMWQGLPSIPKRKNKAVLVSTDKALMSCEE